MSRLKYWKQRKYNKVISHKLVLNDMPPFTYDLLPWNDIIYGWMKWKTFSNKIYHKNALGNKTFGDILFTST